MFFVFFVSVLLFVVVVGVFLGGACEVGVFFSRFLGFFWLGLKQ